MLGGKHAMRNNEGAFNPENLKKHVSNLSPSEERIIHRYKQSSEHLRKRLRVTLSTLRVRDILLKEISKIDQGQKEG